MAIVKNNLAAFRIIPRKANGLNPVKLAPGVNEVEDKIWEEIAPFVADEIKNDEIVVVTVKGKDGKAVSAELKSMDREQAIQVIRQTYYIPQLEAFKKSLTSEELRLECINQIDKVNKEGKKPQGEV